MEPYINTLTQTKGSSSETNDLGILTYPVTMGVDSQAIKDSGQVEKRKLGFKSHNQGMGG